jgi:hypothetical protein
MTAIKIIIILGFLLNYSIFAECDTSSIREYGERSLLDDAYNEEHMYERDGFLASCDDTLNVQEREIDIRLSDGEGMLNGFYSASCSNPDYYKSIRKCEKFRVRIKKDGAREIDKQIYCASKRFFEMFEIGSFYERVIMIYDKNDCLISSKHYKWNGKMLFQTIENGIVRNIIPGETRCDFTIIEPSGDSIFFNLHPKKNLDPSIKIRGDMQFLFYMREDKRRQKFEIGKYDAIIYQWYSFCKGDYEFDPSVFYSEQENEPDIEVEGNDISLSYTSPYKYYAIISICIIAASIVAIRKKWRMKK